MGVRTRRWRALPHGRPSGRHGPRNQARTPTTSPSPGPSASAAARAASSKTSFQNECETDLFGEQVVLCGGLSESIKKGFEVLTEAGYPPELAYFEVCHELELIINLIKRGGLDYMRYSISNTAEFGDYTGPKIVDDDTKKRMQDALKHIQDGGFAKAFRDDYEKGFPWFKQQREENKGHAVEQVGKELRRMMPWLHPVELDEE